MSFSLSHFVYLLVIVENFLKKPHYWKRYQLKGLKDDTALNVLVLAGSRSAETSGLWLLCSIAVEEKGDLWN